MVYRGKVCGRTVVLESADLLPEGAEVTVALVQPDSQNPVPQQILSANVRNGVPVFSRAPHGLTVGLDLVNQLRDSTP